MIRPLALVFLLASTPAWAQRVDSVIGRLPAGSRVRVQLRDMSRVEGWIGVSGAAEHTVAFGNIRRIQVRQRAIGTGAAVGGVIGLGTGVFFGLLAHALCDAVTCGSEASAIATGMVIAGGMGAGTGAIIGAAFPRWKTVWSGTSAEPGSITLRGDSLAAPETIRRHIGEVTIGLVGGGARDPGDGFQVGPTSGSVGGFAASLGFRAGPFAFGPEFSKLFGDVTVSSFSGIGRVDLRDHGRLTPYIVAGAGGYTYRTRQTGNTWLALALGGGVTTDAGWRFEARWEPVIQNTGLPGKPTLVTVRAGRRIRW